MPLLYNKGHSTPLDIKWWALIGILCTPRSLTGGALPVSMVAAKLLACATKQKVLYFSKCLLRYTCLLAVRYP